MNIERSRTSSRPVRQSWGYSFKNTAIYDPSSCPISFIDYEEDSNILYSDLTGANVRGGIALRQEDNSRSHATLPFCRLAHRFQYNESRHLGSQIAK